MRANLVRLVVIALLSTSLHAAGGGSLAHLRMGPAGFALQSLEDVPPVAAIQGAATEPFTPPGQGSELGYEAWARAVFTTAELADPEVSDPEAAYGDDGIANLMKYALGLDPRETATADVLPETGQLDEHGFLWFRRPSDTDDVEYRVEASTDGGATWSSDGVTLEPILANDAAQSWQAHYHGAAGESVQMRLTVTLR